MKHIGTAQEQADTSDTAYLTCQVEEFDADGNTKKEQAMKKYDNLNTRVFAVGFYDGEGVWFYTWARGGA